MIELPYSLVIEATNEPDFFGFFSPELEGFSGVGHSVEDCLHKAKLGMKEHVELLRQLRHPVPPPNPDSIVTIQNEKDACTGFTAMISARRSETSAVTDDIMKVAANEAARLS